MGNGYDMNGGMGWGWIFAIVAIAGIVLLVVLVVRLVGGGIRRGPSPTSAPAVDVSAPVGRSRARQILTERYARGEIDNAEYQERLQHLQDE